MRYSNINNKMFYFTGDLFYNPLYLDLSSPPVFSIVCIVSCVQVSTVGMCDTNWYATLQYTITLVLHAISGMRSSQALPTKTTPPTASPSRVSPVNAADSCGISDHLYTVAPPAHRPQARPNHTAFWRG